MLAHDLSSNKWRSKDIALDTVDESITFDHFNLKTPVFEGLKKNGFIRPSPIQLQSIPIGRCGADLIVQSKSGTGKTCVFVVIALEMVTIESDATQVLIISPTREIASQIGDVITSLSCDIPQLVCCTVIGGTKVKEDRDHLKKCHIVVGTPGRVKQLIELNLLKTNAIRFFVIDEADKLMDDKFKKQIDNIFESLPENKQMIASSATMSNELAQFLSRYMRTPAFVRLNSQNPSLIGVNQYYKTTQFHHLNHINFDNKIDSLFDILRKIPFSQCLIFSNYQTRARMLCDKLNANNWPSAYISAEKSQSERLKAMSKLKKFKCRVLVSTDLTSRGIDVQNINMVINMDIPWDCETYLHRIGRSGRFGSQGFAVTLVSIGREFELFQKIIKECQLSISELPNPIPNNIWNKVSSVEFFTDIGLHDKDNDTEKCENESKSEKNTKTLKILLSLNQIKKRYECYKIMKNNSKKSNDSLKDAFNERKLCDSTQTFDDIKTYKDDRIAINFSVISDNENGYKQIDNSFDNTNSSFDNTLPETEQQSDSIVNNDLTDDKENQKIFMETKQMTDENVCGVFHECTEHHINYESGFGSWTNALFPDPQRIGSPLQYTQWMNSNRYLWSHLLNPYMDIDHTQSSEITFHTSS